MNGYQHSQTFASLKSIKETIGTNLSSYQYLAILDSLLIKSVYPIVDNTKFVDHFLAKILAWQYLNPRRKASSISRSDLASYITFFLITGPTEHKIRYLQKTKLDRGILTEMIRLWLQVVEPYAELVSTPDSLEDENNVLREHAIEQQASLKPDHSLYGAYLQTKYWWNYYQEFRNMILEKYTRMCLVQAQQDYDNAFARRVRLDDVIQIYLFNAVRAIDKCDTEKGVLTTHIQNWLKHAKNQVMTSHLTDTAYSLPKNSKTTGKYLEEANSVSLEELDVDAHDLGIEHEEARESELTRVRKIAKLFDPEGLGRLVLGIQEHLEKEESQALRALATPSNSRYRIDKAGLVTPSL